MNLQAEVPKVTQITNSVEKPAGVISKRAQQYLLVTIAVVIVLVAMFSSNRQRKAGQPALAVVSGVQDTNERKLAAFGSELSDKQKEADRSRARFELPPPSNPPAGTSRLPLVERSADVPQGNGYPAGYYPGSDADSPSANGADNGRDQLAARELERVYNSRFASNFAFAAAAPSPSPAQAIAPNDSALESTPNAQVTTATAAAPATALAPGTKKPAEVNANTATGKPFVIFEGTLLETTLVNRLDGDFSGPVKVLLTNPIYSHDLQHVLIPEGSTILGETKQVSGLGQRRLAVVFHRILMPDGYSVDLDQFRGLNQIGETGLKDKVNNHYAQIFGASIALGLIAGAAEASANNVGVYESGSDAYKQGLASSLSQSATHVLDRFLNILPTLTIREGHRVKVYITQDMLLPAYENHTVPPNI